MAAALRCTRRIDYLLFFYHLPGPWTALLNHFKYYVLYFYDLKDQ